MAMQEADDTPPPKRRVYRRMMRKGERLRVGDVVITYGKRLAGQRGMVELSYPVDVEVTPLARADSKN